MILFSILMFGSAIAIPASRAMQEAEMRDRLAAASAIGDDDQDTEDVADESSSANLPAIAEPEPEGTEVTRERTSAPKPVEDIPRDQDLAGDLTELHGSVSLDDDDDEAQREAKLTHISIPSVEIDTEIYEVGYTVREIDGQRVREWDVASYAAGHHETSARPGEGGNIVVTGHNDWEGEVFRTLEHAEHGQEVIITTEEGEHKYIIEEIHLRHEIGASLEERLETGRFMADMPEERLTLITCWPYGINDHRIVVVALPAD